jgi:hypothetical protein
MKLLASSMPDRRVRQRGIKKPTQTLIMRAQGGGQYNPIGPSTQFDDAQCKSSGSVRLNNFASKNYVSLIKTPGMIKDFQLFIAILYKIVNFVYILIIIIFGLLKISSNE